MSTATWGSRLSGRTNCRSSAMTRAGCATVAPAKLCDHRARSAHHRRIYGSKKELARETDRPTLARRCMSSFTTAQRWSSRSPIAS